MRKPFGKLSVLAIFGAVAMTAFFAGAQSVSLDPAKLQRIATVDERFQSYNVEMLEVTGGKFWKPYSSLAKQTSGTAAPSGNTPAGMDPNMYEYRSPVDLANARLRKLAEALGPAYIRVSGTWANTTYFQDSPGPAPKTPPSGFGGVLTQQQWKGVVDFSKAVNAELVTSVAISPGVRDASGKWTPIEAAKIFAYTQSVGGNIAATEFMNEPNAASMGGAPKGYDAAEYGKDLAVFKYFLPEHSAKTILLGPGSVGEGGALSMPGPGIIPSADLLSVCRRRLRRVFVPRLPGCLQPLLEDGRFYGNDRRRMLSQRNGLLDLKQSRPSTQACVTGSIRGSRSGSQKQRMPHAVVIPGHPPSWIRFAT